MSGNKLKSKFLNSVFSQIMSQLKKIKKKEIKVIDYKTPEELNKIMDFKIYDNEKSSRKEILKYTKNILDYSVHCYSSNYHNTLFGGFDEISLSGEFVTSALNGNMYTYELAPVFTLMEEEIANQFSKLLKWDKHDFIFCPGGSYANFYGVTTARAFKYPNYKKEGMKALPNLKIFVSELAHYSIQKAAILCGFGLDSVVKVKCDKKGKMDVKELDKMINYEISQNNVPLMVVSTLATTVLGSIDPITEIDELCKSKDIWHHVDACLGYGLIFLEEFHQKYKIDRVDSISIDPHKFLNVPLQCSVFLTRKNEGILKESNSTNANYLFMADKKLYDPKLDKGDKSFQCGRHIDIPKFWLYWKYHSTEGIIKKIKSNIKVVDYLVNKIENNKNFELIIKPEFNNVCFHYIPNSMIGVERNEKFYEEIGKLCPDIKAKMIKRGNLMLAYQKLKFNDLNFHNFFRPSICVGKDKEDMDFILDEIHRIGKNM